jgi:predicted phosphodiesterase
MSAGPAQGEAGGRERERRRIHERLDEVRSSARPLDFDLAGDRLVILSDQHKGARDGADDFQRAERSYNAALAYYDHLGYRLVVLGDVEELWENEVEEVTSRYGHTLALEARFHAGGRYTRVWGNHDLAWSDAKLFRDRMRPHGLGDVEPLEAVRLVIRAGAGEILGELLLVHGHQGTDDSEGFAWLSRWAVRHGWRRLQRLLNQPWNTPAVDWGLRGEHASDMADWGHRRGQVLIAGHTHKPVFYGAEKKPAPAPSPPPGGGGPEAEALALARAEWAQAERERVARQRPEELKSPSYFNTGCCSYGDGDVTGIEISGGKIRLVRWLDDEAAPTFKQLAEEPLRDILSAVEGSHQ